MVDQAGKPFEPVSRLRHAPLALLAFAWISGANAQGPPPTAQLYEEKCMACHLPDGKAPLKEMSFAEGDWKRGSRVSDIVKVIREGIDGTAMQPFKEQLSKSEIEALARYVRAFDKRLKPERGEKGKK